MEREVTPLSTETALAVVPQTVIDPKVLLAGPDFINHFDESITDEQYHSDKTHVGSSSLRLVLDSPKAFYWNFFKGEQEPETDAMRLGRIIHKAVLEGREFQNSYCIVPDFGDMRSKANREKKAAWLADRPAGQIMTTQEELDMILGIVESIMEHPQGPDLLKNGKPEVAGYYRDPETNIRLKIKPDFLSFDVGSLVDLKSTRSSEKRRFMSSIFEYRYDIQLFMYSEGTRLITGKKPDLISAIAVEKKIPYESAIYYFQEHNMVQAESDYRQALRRLRQCIDENKWPQRQTMIEPVEEPNWFIYKNTVGAENV